LLDDDQAEAPFEIDTSLIRPSESPEENVLAAAYIRPRTASAGVASATFKRNLPCALGQPCPELSSLLSAVRGVPDATSAAWFALLVAAFQGHENADGDPIKERSTFGQAASLSWGAAVYTEVIRDSVPRERCRQTVPGHEIGHLLGLGHPAEESVEKGADIMGACGAKHPRFFSGPNLKIIRSRGTTR